MRSSRRIAISVGCLPIIFILLFQNCGPAFKSAGRTPSTELGSISSAGNVLKLNPFDGGDAGSDEIDVDFSGRIRLAAIGHLQAGMPYLTNGKFKIDRDSANPDQLAKPNQPLTFAVNDPRFRQTNTYYHLDRFVAKLSELSLFPTEFDLLSADANCEDDDGGKQIYRSNAYYDPSRNLLCLGVADVGEFRAWAANDADVVVHEFGHSINHQVARTDVLFSTLDMGALDEGLADYWAYSQNDNFAIGQWYGSAIYAAMGIRLRPFPGLRNLSVSTVFPASRTGERHADSTYVSTVLTQLEERGADRNKVRELSLRILENMQSMSTFSEVFQSLSTEGEALGLSAGTIDDVLDRSGLLRKDDPGQLSIGVSYPVRVIDAHDTPGYQENGNCDGGLDVGESALIFVDLINSGAELGTVKAFLTSDVPASAIEILPGADSGTYTHFTAGHRYSDSVLGTKGSSSYMTTLFYAAFAVKVNPGTPAGEYHFKIHLAGMNTVDSDALTKTIPFTLNVGTDPNIIGKCPGDGETRVYP